MDEYISDPGKESKISRMQRDFDAARKLYIRQWGRGVHTLGDVIDHDRVCPRFPVVGFVDVYISSFLRGRHVTTP